MAHRISRRRMLQAGVVGAGALWVAPALSTFGASPAAASPLGCTICGQQILQGGTGTTANLTSWSAVSGATSWTSTGTVFQAAGGSGQLNQRRQSIAFSPACVTRFNIAAPAQPQATLTLSGRLRGNFVNFNESSLLVEFLGASSNVLGTAEIASTGGSMPTNPTTFKANIPKGTASLRMTLELYGSGLGSPGQADDLSLTVSAC